VITKPTVEELGIDPDTQEWRRSGEGAGAIEVAFARVTSDVSSVSRAIGFVPGEAIVSGAPDATGVYGNDGSHEPAMPRDGDWILMRVTDDPARRVLVFDRNEWECFLDGARGGEFDDAADNVSS
jgi:Domain of unknown function (DUF397)